MTTRRRQVELVAIPGPRTSKPVRAGDVFFIEYPGKRFIFGRVFRDTLRYDVDGNAFLYLVVLYDYIGSSRDDIPDIDTRRILGDPMRTGREGWTRGYLRYISHIERDDTRFLADYCITIIGKGMYHEDGTLVPGKYFDFDLNPLHDARRVCLRDLITPFPSIDRYLCGYLGIPHPSDAEDD